MDTKMENIYIYSWAQEDFGGFETTDFNDQDDTKDLEASSNLKIFADF